MELIVIKDQIWFNLNKSGIDKSRHDDYEKIDSDHFSPESKFVNRYTHKNSHICAYLLELMGDLVIVSRLQAYPTIDINGILRSGDIRPRNLTN